MKLTKICAIVFVVFLVFACGENHKTKNVSHVEPKTEVLSAPYWHLDTALFHNSSTYAGLMSWSNALSAEHKTFFEIYCSEIMQVGKPDSAGIGQLLGFSSHPDWRKLQEQVEKQYPTTASIDADFNKALGRLSTHFPALTIPALVYYNSGFNVGVWPDRKYLGIGLEWYLGPDNEIVKMLPGELFPRYKKENMKVYYLVPDALKGWLQFTFYKKEYTKDVLNYLCFQGKVMYTLDAILPDMADSLKLNYTSAQVAWSFENESNVWKQFVKDELLFKTSDKLKHQLTSDGPFTPGFPPDSPPMLGVFMAWQMVADYMVKHPDTPLNDLFTKVSAQQILEAYKPN